MYLVTKGNTDSAALLVNFGTYVDEDLTIFYIIWIDSGSRHKPLFKNKGCFTTYFRVTQEQFVQFVATTLFFN